MGEREKRWRLMPLVCGLITTLLGMPHAHATFSASKTERPSRSTEICSHSSDKTSSRKINTARTGKALAPKKNTTTTTTTKKSKAFRLEKRAGSKLAASRTSKRDKPGQEDKVVRETQEEIRRTIIATQAGASKQITDKVGGADSKILAMQGLAKQFGCTTAQQSSVTTGGPGQAAGNSRVTAPQSSLWAAPASATVFADAAKNAANGMGSQPLDVPGLTNVQPGVTGSANNTPSRQLMGFCNAGGTHVLNPACVD